MVECSLNGLKTLCEKEKLLVTSNFPFSHSGFKRLVLQTRENQGLFGKGLNQFPSNVMFGMNGFHVSASGAIQGHHGPLVFEKFEYFL